MVYSEISLNRLSEKVEEPALVIIGLSSFNSSDWILSFSSVKFWIWDNTVNSAGKFTFKDSITSPIVINFRVIL